MPQGDAESYIQLLVDARVARRPLRLTGTLKDGKLEGLSGYLRVDASFGEIPNDLGVDFSAPSRLLSGLTDGAVKDVTVDGLGVAWRGRQPKFVQMEAGVSTAGLACRFALLKLLGTPQQDEKKPGGSLVAGVELRGDGNPLPGNLLAGLIGEVRVDHLAMYYASEACKGLEMPPLDPTAAGALLPAEAGASAQRDFDQGMNFALRIRLGAIDLLPLLGEGAAAEPPPLPRAPTPPPALEPDAKLPPSPVFWVEAKKTIGPVTLRRVGVSFEQGRVGVRLDAGLKLAVLAFTLEGLGLRLPLSALTAGPKAIWEKAEFLLDGASLSFNAGPISISGGLIKAATEELRLDGTLLVKVPMLSIGAIGSYATLPSGQPSFFIFAALHKELGGPAFFFVTGLCLGVGINRKLTLPPITKLHEFPLLRAAKDPDYLGAELDLRKISEAISRYISPSQGDLWLAAGVRFTSFGMIESVAMLSVAFGNRLEIALLGLSTIALPKPVPGTKLAPLAMAELAIKVVIAPEDGLVSVEGRLTEASFVLRDDFTLRGGFAFYAWFAGEHAGDFVVSLGGYHPEFKPPAHYPRPELVAFTCAIDAVTIHGYCYFALCPAAVMAGGGLSIVYQCGGIHAWMVAYADFLVQWKPLYYDVAIGVSIGVSLNLDLEICRVRMSLELSASVALNGPPLAGVARVKLYVVSFTVRFGEAGQPPPALLWEAIDDDRSFAKSFLSNPDVTRVSIADGLLEQIDTADGKLRLVDPQRLHLVCRSTVPATVLGFRGKDLLASGKWPGFGVRPMARSSLYSGIEVTLSPASGATAATRAYLDQYIETEVVTESVPLALWGEQPLDSSRPPPQKQLIEGVPVGLAIRTRPGPRPWQSEVMELEVLAYDRYTRHYPDWHWLQATQKLPAYGKKTVAGTVRDPAVAARRRAIVAALNRQRERPLMDPDAIDLQLLADGADSIFQATPLMARVGQEPPASFEQAGKG